MKTKKWSKGSVQSAFGAAALLFCTAALADNAPDATRRNSSVPVAVNEYRFAAAIDPDVAADRATEIWARVTRPNPLPATRSPLLVFLHGNHATCGVGSNPRVDNNCQYTTSGTCPPAFPIVVPNHAGYQYLADVLASQGYIVVSINANRGITCGGGVTGDGGLNLMRGRLVLKHLEFLSAWNNNPGTTPASLGVDLFNRLDFDNVGLMGHSRGGEGMRAAYNLYRDLGSPWPFFIGPLNVVAIFEIGPVDGQTSRTLNPDGTIWNVLLPMCDGDVSNLEGVKPFDRVLRIDEFPPTQKSTYTVWGANHNFYNTEWQQSDSSPTTGCSGPGHMALFPSTIGSPAQRTTGLASVNALFRGNIGPKANPQFNRNFNPQYNTPFVVSSVTRVDRGFTNSPSSKETLIFEDFDGVTGIGQYGFPTTASFITINHTSVPNHSPVQRAGAITWNAPGDNRFFQTNWTAPLLGVDVSLSSTLDIRLSRQNSGLNPVGPTNFALALGLNDGSLSQTVDINSYTDLRGPVGGPGGLHPILQTARIPLADFATDLTRVRSVRLIFNDTGSGAIFVANIRISASSGSPPAGSGPSAGSIILNDQYNPSPVVPDVISSARIQGIRSVSSSEALEGNPGVELEILSTDVPFLPQNDLPRLRVGDKVIVAPSYYPTGGIESIVFALSHDQYQQLQSGPVSVEYSSKVWNLGNIRL